MKTKKLLQFSALFPMVIILVMCSYTKVQAQTLYKLNKAGDLKFEQSNDTIALRFWIKETIIDSILYNSNNTFVCRFIDSTTGGSTSLYFSCEKIATLPAGKMQFSNTYNGQFESHINGGSVANYKASLKGILLSNQTYAIQGKDDNRGSIYGQVHDYGYPSVNREIFYLNYKRYAMANGSRAGSDAIFVYH